MNRQQQEKALSDPESIEEYRLFVREKGVDALSDERRIRFDELLADQSRSARRAKIADTVTKIDADGAEGLSFSIKEGYHDRQKIPLWIVQLSTRVDRPAFNELKGKAKRLGGWYSSFKKDDAGFQFRTQELAERFSSLLDQDADRTDVLADRKARKMDSAGQHLIVLADALEADAEQILAGDQTKLKNTVRRAEMAAGMRGKGDILDMLRTHHPDAQVTAIELNATLLDVLAAKEHQIDRGDFLEHRGEYDRIIMNPPFENGES